jgi:hypothetical protein
LATKAAAMCKAEFSSVRLASLGERAEQAEALKNAPSREFQAENVRHHT